MGGLLLKNCKSFFLSCLFLAVTASSLYATDYVGGNVSGHWLAAYSPFIATEDVVVPAGETLTIGEGSVVRFEEGVSLIVRGELRVEGANNAMEVRFQAENPGEKWRGIRFENNNQFANNFIRNARFYDCLSGIEVSSSRLEIEGTLIHVTADEDMNNIYALRVINNSSVNARWLTCELQTSASNARVLYAHDSFVNIQDSEFNCKVALIPGGNEAGAVLDFNDVDGSVTYCHISGVTKNSDIIGTIVNRSPNLDFNNNSIKLKTEANTISHALKVTHTPYFLLNHLSIDLQPLGESTIMYGVEAISNSEVLLVNSILSNSAYIGKYNCIGAVVINEDASIEISHTNFYNVTVPNNPRIPVNKFSLVYGNPLWRSIEPPDYELQDQSPCIDAGLPIHGSDPDGTPPDLGMYYFHQHGVGVNPSGNLIPTTTRITKPYPNPFNQTTQFSIDLHRSSSVRVSIHNLLGQVVSLHQKQLYPAGTYHYSWDGKSNGMDVASGQYIVSVQIDDQTHTMKALLLK